MISADIPRYLFAPWVVPVLGGPWAVGFSCTSLPQTCQRTSSTLACRCQSCLRGTWAGSHLHRGGLHSSRAHLLLPGAEVELTFCHCKGEEGGQCQDDQPHYVDGAAVAPMYSALIPH